jgi:hypothetical protein
VKVGELFSLNNEEYEIIDDYDMELPAEDDDDENDSWQWFHVLNHDTNSEYFLLFEDNEDFGYLLSECEERIRQDDWMFETGNQVILEDELLGYMAGTFVDVDHGRLLTPELSADLEGPLQNTPWITRLERVNFFQRPIYKEREGVFYTDAFPASDIETPEVKWRKFSGARFLPNLILLLGMVGLGIGQFLQIGGSLDIPQNLPFLDAFWIVGLACVVLAFVGRSLPIHRFIETMAAAFAFFLCMKSADNFIFQNFRGDSVAIGQSMVALRLGSLMLFVGLQLLSRRWYGIFSRAAFWSATVSLGIFAAGILLYSIIDEYWWGAHFSFYLGASFWGLMWPAIFVWNLWSKYKDFKAVPLTEKDFERHLAKMCEEFEQGAEHVHHIAHELSVMADDTSDAVNLSDTPSIVAFEHFETSFDTLCSVLETYHNADLEEFESLEYIDEDLDVLVEDIEAMRDAFQSRQFQRPLLDIRISPALRAYAARKEHLSE